MLLEIHDHAATIDLSVLVNRLIGEMVAEGIEDPLGATVSLGAVIDDLSRLAGVVTPIGVDAWAGGVR